MDIEGSKANMKVATLNLKLASLRIHTAIRSILGDPGGASRDIASSLATSSLWVSDDGKEEESWKKIALERRQHYRYGGYRLQEKNRKKIRV